MPTLSHFKALSSSRIVAHKRSGNALVYLSQNSGSFFLTFGEIVNGKFRLIVEKTLSIEEAHDVLLNIFQKEGTKETVSETLLLEVSNAFNISYPELVSEVSKHSPYFSTKDIFLSVQQTRGPNL